MSTEKSRPIEGYRQPQESEKDKPVDPKRFEEELNKVHESGASEQRKKRNLKKSEEGEDEEGLEVAPNLISPGDAFKLTMEGDEKENALSIQSPSNAKGLSSSPSSGKIIEFDESSSSKATSQEPPQTPELESSSSKPSTPTAPTTQAATPTPTPSFTEEAPATQEVIPAPSQEQSPQPTETNSQNFNNDNTSSNSSTPSNNLTKPEEKTAPSASSPEKSHKKKKKHKDTSLINKQKPSFDEYLRKKKNKPMKDLKFDPASKTVKEEGNAKPQEKKPKVEEQAKGLKTNQKEQTMAPKAEGAVVSSNQKKPHEEKGKLPPNAKEVAGISSKTVTTDTKAKKDHEKDDQKEEQASEELQVQTDISAQPNIAPTPSNAPATSKLHPQVFELFEKMVGLITVEQHRDSATTTVTVAMKGSVFDGAKIVLEHSGTKSFNLELQGSPKAVELFNENISDLASAFASSKYSFDVNIKRPSLLEKHRALEKKGRVTQKKDHGQKN